HSLNRWFISDPSKHARVDELFGDGAWRVCLRIEEGRDREDCLIETYMRALAKHGWDGVAFRMVDAKNQPLYYLIFGTTNPAGKRVFKEAARYVSPSGVFRYSDFSDPGQLQFKEITEELLASQLAEEVFARFRGRGAPKDELTVFVDRHPLAVPKDLTAALRQLESRKPPLILSVTRKDSTQARRGSFPPGSTIHFAP
ncbi:MAG: hypothetical protein FJ313_01165, partial [Gemmatimonadetes bacterium]|nr:hypothetical protein [Gemmatimonadota bacterium]